MFSSTFFRQSIWISLFILIGFFAGRYSVLYSPAYSPTTSENTEQTENHIVQYQTTSQASNPFASKKNSTATDHTTLNETTASRSLQEISEKNYKPLSHFKNLLETHQYTAATQLYEDAFNKKANDFIQLRQILIQHLNALLNHSKSAIDSTHEFDDYFIELTNLHLSTYYDDIDVLLLLAQFNFLKNDIHEALSMIHLAYNYTDNNEQKSSILEAYKKSIAKVDELFSSENRWFELIDIYKAAEHYDLALPQDIFRLTKLYLDQEDDINAQFVAKNIQHMNPWGKQLKQLFASYYQEHDPIDSHEQTSNDHRDRIALVRLGSHFIANIQLSNKTVPLMIDTGASITTLSADFFNRIKSSTKATYIGSRVFNTANGLTRGKMYHVKQISIGQFTLDSMKIAVLDSMDSSQSAGLLGMNLLRHFRFEIDQDTAELLLAPR